MPDRPYSALGALIQSARRRKGLTQERLAAELGLSTNYVYRLEKGDRRPSERQLQRLIDSLGIEGPRRSEFEKVSGWVADQAQRSHPALRSVEMILAEGHSSDQLKRFTQRISEVAGRFRAEQRAMRRAVRMVVVPLGRLEAGLLGDQQIYRLLTHASREADAAKLKEMLLILPAGIPNGKPLVNRLNTEVRVKIKAVEQRRPGLAEALLAAEPTVGVEPFAVLLPTCVSPSHTAMGRLVDAHSAIHQSLFGVGPGDMQVEAREVLGFVALGETADESEFTDSRPIQRFVTQVKFQGPSDWRPVLGRLVLSPAIFDELRVKSAVSEETGQRELALALINYVQGPLCHAVEVQGEMPFRQLPRLVNDALGSMEVSRKPVQGAGSGERKKHEEDVAS